MKLIACFLVGKAIFKGLGFAVFGRPSLISLELDRIDNEIGWMASLKFVMSSAALEESEVSGDSKRPWTTML